MHNLYPHESDSRDLDRLARLAITQIASAVIVHCNYARDLVKQHFFRDSGVFVIPHGHFVDPYANTLSQAEARAKLNIPKDKFVYLFFGNVRPNKGVEHLLDAFTNISGEDDVLLLAAKVYSDYGSSLVDLVAGKSQRIAVHASSFFGSDELQLYFNASNAVVLPFVDILTSGSVITALSFTRPVVVPAMGCLPELVDDAVGVLYDPRERGSLEKAMTVIKARTLESYEQGIRLRLQMLDWDPIAQLTLEAYQR